MHNLFRSIGEAPPDDQYCEASPSILSHHVGVAHGRIDSPHRGSHPGVNFSPYDSRPPTHASLVAHAAQSGRGLPHEHTAATINGIVLPSPSSRLSPSHHRFPPMTYEGKHNNISGTFNNASSVHASPGLSSAESQSRSSQKPFFNASPRPESLSRMSGEFSPMPMRPSWRTSEPKRSQAVTGYSADAVGALTRADDDRGHGAPLSPFYGRNTFQDPNNEVTTPHDIGGEGEASNRDPTTDEGGGGIVQGLLRSARRIRKSLTSMTTSPVRSPSRPFEYLEESTANNGSIVQRESGPNLQPAAVNESPPLHRPQAPAAVTTNDNLSTVAAEESSILLERSSSLRGSLLAAASSQSTVSKAASLSGPRLHASIGNTMSGAASVPTASDSWPQAAGSGSHDRTSRLQKHKPSVPTAPHGHEPLGLPQMKPKRRVIQLEQRLKMANQIGACRAAALQRRDLELHKLRSVLNSHLPPRRTRGVQTGLGGDFEEIRESRQLSSTRVCPLVVLLPASRYLVAVCTAELNIISEGSSSAEVDKIHFEAERTLAEANAHHLQLQKHLDSAVVKTVASEEVIASKVTQLAAMEVSSQKAAHAAKIAEVDIKTLRSKVAQLESELQELQSFQNIEKDRGCNLSVVEAACVDMIAAQVKHVAANGENIGFDSDPQRDSDTALHNDVECRDHRGSSADEKDDAPPRQQSKYNTPEPPIIATPEKISTSRRYRLRSGQQSSAAPSNTQAATKTRKKRTTSKASEVDTTGDAATRPSKEERPVSGRGRKKKSETH